MSSFDFMTDYTLEDKRVQLRPLKLSDYSHFLPFALQEPEIWKYSMVPASGEKGMKDFLDTALRAREARTEYPFTVFDKQAGKYAGSTRFYDIQLPHDTLQLGYTWYGKEFQGTGLNKHCKYLLLQFAFEAMHMERVEFRANNHNAKSIAAMKSIGCTEEGVLRRNGKATDGSRRDSIVLSILRDEWEGHVKEKLEKQLT